LPIADFDKGRGVSPHPNPLPEGEGRSEGERNEAPAMSLEMTQASADHRAFNEAVGTQIHAADSFKQFGDGHLEKIIRGIEILQRS
jgi:hypothetical protein